MSDPTLGYYEYEDLGPECAVCLQPIEDAATHRTKYHVECGKQFRRAYQRYRYGAISKRGRFLTDEELQHVHDLACTAAANVIAEREAQSSSS